MEISPLSPKVAITAHPFSGLFRKKFGRNYKDFVGAFCNQIQRIIISSLVIKTTGIHILIYYSAKMKNTISFFEQKTVYATRDFSRLI